MENFDEKLIPNEIKVSMKIKAQPLQQDIR